MPKKPGKPDDLPSFENRKARHLYAIEDTLECGVMLQGSEIKSVRNGHVSLGEGFCRVQESPPALMLYQVHIGEYSPAASLGHKPTRARVLLANKREIIRLARKMSKGMTIVPLKLYFQGKWAKVLIGMAKGRKAHDKREAIKKRENDRDLLRLNSRRA